MTSYCTESDNKRMIVITNRNKNINHRAKLEQNADKSSRSLTRNTQLPINTCEQVYNVEEEEENAKHRKVKFVKEPSTSCETENDVMKNLMYAFQESKHHHGEFNNKYNKRSSTSINVMELCEEFNSHTLTDFEAESIMSPFVAIHTRELISILLNQLRVQITKIEWSRYPTAHLEWLFDLRFYGDWWLSLQDYTLENVNGALDCKEHLTKVSKYFFKENDTTRDNCITTHMLNQRNNLQNYEQSTCQLEKEREKKEYCNWKAKPLLLPEQIHDEHCINSLISDLTLRMQGPLFRLELLHLDHFNLNAERMHVLFYKGIFAHEKIHAYKQQQQQEEEEQQEEEQEEYRNREREETNTSSDSWYDYIYHSDYAKAAIKQHLSFSNHNNERNNAHEILDTIQFKNNESDNVSRKVKVNNVEDVQQNVTTNESTSQHELTTLSFSICNISSASLMLLLLSLIASSTEKCLSITHLDVSYNALSEHSLRCFARLLPMTKITHLSVRGNKLSGQDNRTFRDFLRIGCAHIEELDLCFTQLMSEQITILIECLPILSRLRILLLDGVDINSDKAPLLTKAVARSRLCKISLNGSFAADAQSYVSLMYSKCQQRMMSCSDYPLSLAGRKMSNSQTVMSFFEELFFHSHSRGWRPPTLAASTQQFYEYRTNDPSIYNAINK